MLRHVSNDADRLSRCDTSGVNNCRLTVAKKNLQRWTIEKKVMTRFRVTGGGGTTGHVHRMDFRPKTKFWISSGSRIGNSANIPALRLKTGMMNSG